MTLEHNAACWMHLKFIHKLPSVIKLENIYPICHWHLPEFFLWFCANSLSTFWQIEVIFSNIFRFFKLNYTSTGSQSLLPLILQRKFLSYWRLALQRTLKHCNGSGDLTKVLERSCPPELTTFGFARKIVLQYMENY